MAKFRIVEKTSKIIATEDIPVHGVKKGDVGGRVIIDTGKDQLEKMFRDNAWVEKNAEVKNSEMSGNSIVKGFSMVVGSVLSDNAIVDGAILDGSSIVTDFPERHQTIVLKCKLSGNSVIASSAFIENTNLSGNQQLHLMNSKGLTYEQICNLSYKVVGIHEVPENMRTSLVNVYYKIQATRDIPAIGVKKGDMGGLINSLSAYVESKERFEPVIQDDSWLFEGSILNNSIVSKNSTVRGLVKLTKSIVTNKSNVDGIGELSGSKILNGSTAILQSEGKSTIYANVLLSNEKRLLTPSSN